jgi:hypothetical protein
MAKFHAHIATDVHTKDAACAMGKEILGRMVTNIRAESAAETANSIAFPAATPAMSHAQLAREPENWTAAHATHGELYLVNTARQQDFELPIRHDNIPQP